MKGRTMEYWVKGLPLPMGCDDIGIEGIIEHPDGDIRCLFTDDVPEHVKRKMKHLHVGEHIIVRKSRISTFIKGIAKWLRIQRNK
jgi:hypothetical protein